METAEFYSLFEQRDEHYNNTTEKILRALSPELCNGICRYLSKDNIIHNAELHFIDINLTEDTVTIVGSLELQYVDTQEETKSFMLQLPSSLALRGDETGIVDFLVNIDNEMDKFEDLVTPKDSNFTIEALSETQKIQLSLFLSMPREQKPIVH